MSHFFSCCFQVECSIVESNIIWNKTALESNILFLGGLTNFVLFKKRYQHLYAELGQVKNGGTLEKCVM